MKKKIIISAILLVALIIAIVDGCNLADIYNGKGREFDRAEREPHNTYGLLLAPSAKTETNTSPQSQMDSTWSFPAQTAT